MKLVPTALKTTLALLLMVLAGAFVFQCLVCHPSDLLVGPQNGGRNDLNQFISFRNLPGGLVENLGAAPVWNPNSLCGAPWLGNPQAGLFYPPNWIYYLIDAHSALSWMMVLHHLWAGLGAYCLCRTYGFQRCAALLGGVAFLACPYYLAHTGEGHYNQVCEVAWFPWALLAYEQLNAERRRGTLCLVLVLSACFFCGHVQEVYYLALALVAFVLCDVTSLLAAGETNRAWRLLGRFTLVGCGTAGLVAIELVPNWYYTQLAVRGGGMSVEQAEAISLDWSNLWQLLNPMALGGPADYSGPGLFYWETLCHFGLVPTFLSGIAIVWGWRRRPVRKLAVLWLVALLFALGDSTPVYPLFHEFVPGVALFRAPARALFLCSLAVAVLAAAGADSIARRRELAFDPSSNESELPAVPGHWQRVFAGLVVIVAIEAANFAEQIFRTVPAEGIRRQSSLGEFLAQAGPTERVLCPQFLLSDREAWPTHIRRLQGYEPVPLRHLAAAAGAAYSGKDTAAMLLGFAWFDLAEFHRPVLDAMGIRLAVTVRKQPEPLAGWRLVKQGQVREEFTLRGQAARALPYFVYENTDWLPRAFVVGQARGLEDGADAIAQLSSINPRQEVLLPRDVLPSGRRSEYVPAKIIEDSPNRIVAEVEIAEPGYLVLSDTWYPGWRAFDNGNPVAVLRANLAFRAVALDRGKHLVEFSYSPPGLSLAVLLSAVSAIVLLAWTWLGPRKASEDAPRPAFGHLHPGGEGLN